MLFLNDEISKAIQNDKTHLIELYGLPDSGASSASVFILKSLPGLNLYLGLKQNSQQVELFKTYLGDRAEDTVCCFNQDEEELIRHIKTVAPEIDNIVIDDFAYYILHRPKKEIKRLISILYAKALEFEIKIIIVNQLRFDVWSRFSIKYPQAAQTSLKTLYSSYLEPYIDLRVKVERGDNENHKNITVSVDHDFKQTPSRSSRLLAMFKDGRRLRNLN